MGLTSHQRPVRGATDVWLTPPEIINALGPFDLDPCAPADRPWPTANHHWTEADDGLTMPWTGLVWCNPPFGPEAGKWLARCAEHGHAIALVPARTETRWFIEQVWDKAHAVFFLHGRPHFHYPDGTRAPFNSGAPIVLVAYGEDAYYRLADTELRGTFLSLLSAWEFKA